MFFRQIPAVDASLSYFFGCATAGKAVAVDVVAGDEGLFTEAADSSKVEIAYVIDTHVHADHYSGGRELARRVGAPYCLHESNRANVRFDFLPLADGQLLDLGNVKVAVLHTPGHTTDSICPSRGRYRSPSCVGGSQSFPRTSRSSRTAADRSA